MADTVHEKFCKMLEKTNIEYNSIDIPDNLSANNISNPTQISGFLSRLIPVCKDNKFQTNTMRNEKSRRDILSGILGKSGVAAKLKKIKLPNTSKPFKVKDLNAPAFRKISDEIKKIENYDVLKLDVKAREDLKGLIENYLLKKKDATATVVLTNIKSKLKELEKKSKLTDNEEIEKGNMYIRLDKIAVSLIILYCIKCWEADELNALEGQKAPQQSSLWRPRQSTQYPPTSQNPPQVTRRAQPNHNQQPQQQPPQVNRARQNRDQQPQQQQQMQPQQQWAQQQQPWAQQQQQMQPQQQWAQQQQQMQPQQQWAQQQQPWAQQQQQMQPQQQWAQQQQQTQQQIQGERNRQFILYDQQADKNEASRNSVRNSISGTLKSLNQQLAPLYNFDGQYEYLSKCLKQAEDSRSANTENLRQLVAQADYNLLAATVQSAPIEAEKELQLKKLEDVYQITALNEFELISSQPKDSLPELNLEERQFLNHNVGVALQCFKNYTELSKFNKQMAAINRKINKINKKYSSGGMMSGDDLSCRSRLEEEWKALKAKKDALGYNENGVVEFQASALYNLLSRPKLLDNPEYRKQAIFLFKQLNVMDYDGATSRLQTQKLDEILYMKDENGNVRYKASAIKLLSYFSQPKTLTSQDLKEKANSAKINPMSSDVRYKVGLVLSNKKIGMEEEKDYLEASETLDIYNEAFSKMGLDKEKIHHIMMGASQSNGLESMSTSHSSFSQYVLDKTQGPGNKNVCPQAAALCDVMYEAGLLKALDTAKPVIDYLAGKGLILQVKSSNKDIGTWIPTLRYYNQKIFIKNDRRKKANYLKTRFVIANNPNYFGHNIQNYAYPFYKNGYIQPSSLNIEGRRLFSEAMKSVQCSYMSQECSSDGGEKNDHTQNFAAAFSYQDFGNRGPLIDGLESTLTPEQQEKEIIRNNLMNFQWVYPQYNNIIKQAIIKSAELPADNLIMVHLTRIGQGAFGNPKGIPTLAMAAAILENEEKLRGSNIVIQKEWLPDNDYNDAQFCIQRLSKDLVEEYLSQECKNALFEINNNIQNEQYLFFNRTIYY